MSAALRKAFLLDPGLVFLNHGSFGAVPREVLRAWQVLQREAERNPVAFFARDSGARLACARAALAAFVGADPGQLAFVTNATTGVHVAAQTLLQALPLDAGDAAAGGERIGDLVELLVWSGEDATAAWAEASLAPPFSLQVLDPAGTGP